MTVLDYALEYAGRGWPVFPCRGKVPATRRGFYDASVDPEQIRRWTWHDSIGICTGNGLVVLDVDPRHGGNDSLRELEDAHGEIRTLSARTGGGGLHLYLAGELPARNGFRPGLDLKARGGYVIAPPSLHESGNRYEWIAVENLPETPQPVPAWLAMIVDPPRQEVRNTVTHFPTGAHGSRYIAAAIERECTAVATAPKGERNASLNRAAYALARFAATGEADAGAIREALTLGARHAGLPRREIEKTIQSAFTARTAA
jgi:hypothetical protein